MFSSASSSFCIRPASSPFRAFSKVGFMVISARSGFSPAFARPFLTAAKSAGEETTFRTVVVGGDVLGAGVERRFQDFFFARPGREDELAAVLEEERDRAVGAE